MQNPFTHKITNPFHLVYECKHYITYRTTVELMLNWICDFEIKESPDWRGIAQDLGDQFDWTISHGPTPSDPTGPDHALTGQDSGLPTSMLANHVSPVIQQSEYMNHAS